jgi:DNA-binding MarR family transcriptional regulator
MCVRLTPEQLDVWRTFLRAHASITRRLESDLVAEQGLPLASYDVLVQLVESPDHRLRMAELAERVLLSRSGLTRLVDRLERDGLVVREPSVEDARGIEAVLTEAGYGRLREASRTHLRGVGEQFAGRLTDDELTALGKLLEHLVEPPA